MALEYIWFVLRKAVGIDSFDGSTVMQVDLMRDMIASREGMTQGPTHMSIIYSSD